jgi:quinolinate synthase
MQTELTPSAPVKSIPIKFERFQATDDADCQQRILAAKEKLGKNLVILGHHYQNEGVYRHADYTGDSLKLSRYTENLDAKYIVFLGVHFMAEVADILSRPDQVVILPDLAAGCSMADMANLAKVERSYRELNKVLNLKRLRLSPISTPQPI